MRILIIGGNIAAMRIDLFDNLTPTKIVKFNKDALFVTLEDESLVKLARVETMRDVDNFRGLRFDMIIEHPSFNRKRDLLYALRAIVLK